LHQALEINPQFPASWFRLGACALKDKDWQLARTAYANVVSLEPEDGDAWANLCTVLIQLGEWQQALRAIAEASKFANMNWRIWDSYVTVAITCGEWDTALHCLDTLLELGMRRADSGGRQVDPRALIHVVNGIVKRYNDQPDDFAKRLCDRLERFFDKIKVGDIIKFALTFIVF